MTLPPSPDNTSNLLLASCSGALLVSLHNHKCLSLLNALFVVLHELHLIHTDLKPENILLVHNDFKTVHIPVPGKVR